MSVDINKQIVYLDSDKNLSVTYVCIGKVTLT